MRALAACKTCCCVPQNSVSVFICCELPEEFYCYIAELSMISSIALATQETKTSCLVVVILL